MAHSSVMIRLSMYVPVNPTAPFSTGLFPSPSQAQDVVEMETQITLLSFTNVAGTSTNKDIVSYVKFSISQYSETAQ